MGQVKDVAVAKAVYSKTGKTVLTLWYHWATSRAVELAIF